MKTLVEKWNHSKEHSFYIKERIMTRKFGEKQVVILRTHDEYEITVITGGSGKRFIGNSIDNFSNGDVFIIGPNLPHTIQLDENQKIKMLTLHFLTDTFGNRFFEVPENSLILKLLRDSQLGVAFKGVTVDDIMDRLQNLMVQKGNERLINFFRLLDEFSKMKNRRLLTSHGFRKIRNKDYSLVNKTYEYIIAKFGDKTISLNDIAEHVNMSSSTFSRFFKKHFYKTYTQFLNEVRIGHACKLLQETNQNIAQVAYASGYNHIAHFNKQFKKIMGYSPKKYRKELN